MNPPIKNLIAIAGIHSKVPIPPTFLLQQCFSLKSQPPAWCMVRHSGAPLPPCHEQMLCHWLRLKIILTWQQGEGRAEAKRQLCSSLNTNEGTSAQPPLPLLSQCPHSLSLSHTHLSRCTSLFKNITCIKRLFISAQTSGRSLKSAVCCKCDYFFPLPFPCCAHCGLAAWQWADGLVHISTLVPPVVSALSKQMLHQISLYMAEQWEFRTVTSWPPLKDSRCLPPW